MNTSRILLATLSMAWLGSGNGWSEEVLPKHITPKTQLVIQRGLDWLAENQGRDGAWHNAGGEAYPVAVSSLAGTALLAHGNTATRGKYAPQLAALTDYLIKCCGRNGLITGPNEELGRPMHGHGFALMYLASVYGSTVKESKRAEIQLAIQRAVTLTAEGQSGLGGWTYTPGSGDEGSVTVTQVQALRACHNAGFLVPKSTIEKAVRYIEACKTPEGGICYSYGSGGGPRLAISAAAVATLYNAGEYDAPVAKECLNFVWEQFTGHSGFSKGGGHDFYTHLYASQGFYLSGDKYWDRYFPETREFLIESQKNDGSWEGDGIGPTYGTAIACIILQLPYKFLPVYQR